METKIFLKDAIFPVYFTLFINRETAVPESSPEKNI